MRPFEFEVAVAAGLEEVWRQISTAEGRAAWFGTEASIELFDGGASRVGWGGPEAIDGTVRDVDAPRRLRIVYEHEGQEMGAEEYLLAHEDGVTTVQLIQSMPGDPGSWEDWYGDLERGWRLFLASLSFAATAAARPLRTASSRYLATAPDRAAGWAAALASLGLDQPAPGDVVDLPGMEGATVRLVDAPHSLLATTPARTLVLDMEGAGDQLVLYAQTASHGADTEDELAWRVDVLTALERAVAP